ICVLFRPLVTYWVEQSMVAQEEEMPIHPHIYNRLLAMGRQPLGTMWTRDWVTYDGYLRTYHYRVFGAGEGKWFASLWVETEGESARITLTSCFDDGATVGTTNITALH